MNKAKYLRELSLLLMSKESLRYNGEGKKIFGKIGLKAMRELAELLELEEYDVNFNPAGIACSGDLRLIGMWSEGNGIYVSMNKDFPNSLWGQVLYRTVKHMKDWTGGSNNYVHFDTLGKPGELEKILSRLRV